MQPALSMPAFDAIAAGHFVEHVHDPVRVLAD